MLWIAFVLCTFGLIYSPQNYCMTSYHVVNCFRSLYLWVDLQPDHSSDEPRIVVNCFRSLYLWVDLQQQYQERNKACRCELLSFFVPLGWFTAVLRYMDAVHSCELLSFFVPLGWFTAKIVVVKCLVRLWIAFVLCTFGLIYSAPKESRAAPQVVNCFRSLYLWVDLQPKL